MHLAHVLAALHNAQIDQLQDFLHSFKTQMLDESAEFLL